VGLPSGKTKRTGGPLLWSLLLIVIGIVLLLNNFLLLGDFNTISLLPLVLVVIGAQILLRGDLTPNTDARRFGITRGSVEAATLEISSGEIDVDIRALSADFKLRDGHHALIAGQYATQSRPQMRMDNTYAHLVMRRHDTPWLSFADWKIALANDLPWQILTSTSLGQIDYDLSDIIVHDAVLATGIGDMRVVCPKEAFGTLHLQSTLGNINFITPEGYNTRIIVKATRFFNVHADETRYEAVESNIFVSIENDENAPLIDIHIRGTFGDVYLV
jgi:hypothetical protein